MQAEQDAGDDPEIATTAANRVEEIGLMLRIHMPNPAIRRHDLGAEHRIDGHPELAHEVADPASERDPADADRPRVTEADCETVFRQCFRYLTRGRSCLDRRRTRLSVDLD